MTKLTYAIKNGDNISKDLIIRNLETLEDEKHVDLKEFLLKVFNKTTE